MADRTQPTTAPQSTATPPHPPYTPRSTSIADDSETEFDPTPLHSPGGPQYEDLPPSYDFALSDARNGVPSLDASQIEAHRVSANEGPDEPEVWEYRMRGESTGDDETHQHEHEEAPAYEGHVPVQHVASSENIPVGRVGDFHAATSTGSRGVSSPEDPPHSIPDSGSRYGGTAGRGTHLQQPWTPFGAPGFGPFGPPGNGPFGAPGNGPFGPMGNSTFGRGPGFGNRGCGRRSGRGRHGRGARSGSSQDWAAVGQNIGRMGEELGRRVGALGQQIGRQAGAMGDQIGREAGAMGLQIGRGASSWATAYTTTSTSGQATASASASATATRELPGYDEPPSYQEPAGLASQESGVLHSDRKVNIYPPEKVPQSTSEQPPEKTLGKHNSQDYDDDDDSSISSESSDSSSSSESEDNDYDEAQASFLRRIESINKAAEAAASKGKKTREEIEHERDLAIAKATREKEDAEFRLAQKRSRRMQKREMRNRRRELTREYRQKKRDLREKAQSSGKGKGKAKKGADWKEVKRDFKAKRRALKRERMDAKREWKRERREGKRGCKEGPMREKAEQKVLSEKS